MSRTLQLFELPLFKEQKDIKREIARERERPKKQKNMSNKLAFADKLMSF